jgi:hypothetical protein
MEGVKLESNFHSIPTPLRYQKLQTACTACSDTANFICLEYIMKNALLTFTLLFTLSVAGAQNSPQAIEAAKRHRAEKAGDSFSQVATSKNATTVAGPVQSKGSVAQQLESCKTNAKWNVYKRERCVWSLCKGRWGKDGCPPQSSGNTNTKP